jgi:hypothetical protein
LALCCIHGAAPRAIAQRNEKLTFDAAKQEYEQSPHDEAARLIYVTELARIADPLVADYRQSGQRHDELMSLNQL